MSNSVQHPTPDRSLTNRKIDNGKIVLTHLLGCGTFGSVYQARETHYPYTEYAVKALKKTSPTDGRWNSEIVHHREVSDHPNICTIHRVIEEKKFIFVLMDLCQCGDLQAAIEKRAIYYGRDELLKAAFIGALDAVEACHERGIFHRDLKPDNFLVSPDGARVWLTDFGIATKKKSSDEYAGTPCYKSPNAIQVVQGTKSGSLRVVAKPYVHQANDIWACGLILVNMLIGCDPWRFAIPYLDGNYRLFLGDKGIFLHCYPISNEANDLIRKILHPQVKMRPSLKEIRRDIEKVKTFFLTDQELLKASNRAREKAFRLHLKQMQFQFKPPASATITTPPAEQNSALGRIRSMFVGLDGSRRNKDPHAPAIVLTPKSAHPEATVRPRFISAMSSQLVLDGPQPLTRENVDATNSSTLKPRRMGSAFLGLPSLGINKIAAMSTDSLSPGLCPSDRAYSPTQDSSPSTMFKFKTWGAGLSAGTTTEKEKSGLGRRKLSRIFLPVTNGGAAC